MNEERTRLESLPLSQITVFQNLTEQSMCIENCRNMTMKGIKSEREIVVSRICVDEYENR